MSYGRTIPLQEWMCAMREAIYIVEYTSIPVGIDMLDRMVKSASVSVIYARPICIGKFLIVLGGDVGDVRQAQKTVMDSDEKRLLKEHLLTNAHREILAYFKRSPSDRAPIQGKTAVGILETREIASGFQSLDAALKSGSVQLEQVWMGHFIGGKFCYLLSGSVEDIGTAIEAAGRGLGEKSLVESRIIPSPDSQTLEQLIKAYST